MYDKLKQMDKKEIDLPETVYSRDIESKVFQAIVFQCLTKIEGISLIGGTLIDSLLGRDAAERYKGIYVEQDQKKHSVSIRVEINIVYGLSIPEKSEEIQTKVVEEVSNFSGLHVSCVHVIFKNLVPELSRAKEEDLEEIEEVETEEELIEEKSSQEV